MNAAEARKIRNSAAWKAMRRVILAEEDYCAICHQIVDKTLPKNLPPSPEVDHIIPLEKGGAPLDRNNLTLMHKVCNQRKGNRILSMSDRNKLKKQLNTERYRGPEEDWSSILGD